MIDQTIEDGLKSIEKIASLVVCDVMEKAKSQASNLQRTAIFGIVSHILGNWKAILVLNRHGLDNQLGTVLANSQASLVRCMYDALIQLLYLTATPSEVQKRSEDYHAFAIIEQKRYLERIVNGTSNLSRRLSATSARLQTAPIICDEHDKIKSRFTINGRIRLHWYPGNLAQLAADIGKSEEYSWYVAFTNSSVHAGPFAVLRGPLGPSRDDSVLAAVSILCQALAVVINTFALKPRDEHQKFIDEFSVDICNR